MRLIYFVLGVFAKMNAALRRFSINFIPFNVGFMCTTAIMGYVCLDEALDGLRNASKPVEVSFAQLQHQELLQNFVTISGVFVPVAVYEYKRSGRVEKSWAPLVEPDRKRLILVQRSSGHMEGKAEARTITGMLRSVDSDVRKRLAAAKDQIEDIPVETRYMLVEGESPSNAQGALFGAAIALGVLMCFVTVMVLRNTVFEPSGGLTPGAAIPVTEEAVQVRATGWFVLEGNSTRRFNNVPAFLTMSAGAPVLLSNINASSSFMGFQTTKREGIWTLVVRPGTLGVGEVGYLYYGFSRLPALRFSYRDQHNSARTAVIAVTEKPVLDTVFAFLGAAGLRLGAPDRTGA